MLPVTDDLIAELALVLSAESGVALQVRPIEAPGGYRYLGVVPLHVPPGYEFGIGFSWTSRHVEALFRPDRFSGRLVRDIGDGVGMAPSGWLGLVADATAAGVDVEVVINGTQLDPRDAPSIGDWRSVEVACSRRLPREPAGRQHAFRGALAAVGRSGLGLVLSGLALELVGPSFVGVVEGREIEITTTLYERSPVNRMRCINQFGWSCQVCGFDFEERYGALGTRFIEVHHLTPVSSMGGEQVVDPLTDLIPLCSNCHSMAHRESPPLAPHALRLALGLPERVVASDADAIIS
jgi:5-methylcytosine-specific restriction protein A